MPRISLTEIAHQLLTETLLPGDWVIDATLGNGHDTLFLAECVGKAGRVFGFDIQPQAIQNTRQRLLEQGVTAGVSLFLAGHEHMLAYLPRQASGMIKAVVFNLGYLPGADKSLITRSETTHSAMTAATELLAKQGLISVMAYPGHPGGDAEAEMLAQWCANLDTHTFEYQCILPTTSNSKAPRLFAIRKLA